MATYQQELFNYLYDEFGVIALETEMKEIEEIVLKFQSEKVLDNQKNKIVSIFVTSYGEAVARKW